MWVTTDNKNSIYAWNLATDKPDMVIKPIYHKESIIDMCELVHIKVFFLQIYLLKIKK